MKEFRQRLTLSPIQMEKNNKQNDIKLLKNYRKKVPEARLKIENKTSIQALQNDSPLLSPHQSQFQLQINKEIYNNESNNNFNIKQLYENSMDMLDEKSRKKMKKQKSSIETLINRNQLDSTFGSNQYTMILDKPLQRKQSIFNTFDIKDENLKNQSHMKVDQSQISIIRKEGPESHINSTFQNNLSQQLSFSQIHNIQQSVFQNSKSNNSLCLTKSFTRNLYDENKNSQKSHFRLNFHPETVLQLQIRESIEKNTKGYINSYIDTSKHQFRDEIIKINQKPFYGKFKTIVEFGNADIKSAKYWYTNVKSQLKEYKQKRFDKNKIQQIINQQQQKIIRALRNNNHYQRGNYLQSLLS